MCLLCAAVPATLAVGANLNAKQMQEKRNAEARGETPSKITKISIGKMTGVAIGVLVVSSAVYHSQLNG